MAFDLGHLLRKDEIEVWPENWRAVELLIRLGTQWRVGMGGMTGLDYGVMLTMMDRMRLSDTEHDELFEDMQYLEHEAMEAVRESVE